MLYRGLIVDNTYQVCEEIGSGGMGVVYLAYHLRLDKYVVMKMIKNSCADISMLRNEVDILKALHHPYLPQVYDFISYDGDMYTIIDYIEGYDLKYYIDNGIEVNESQLIKWLRQLCEVLIYLHSHEPRVLHTDIKPANIIVQPNGDICLIDFGVSLLGSDDIKGISYRYSSPEQYYNVTCIQAGDYESITELDERTDLYSLGVSFYQLITQITPTCLSELPRVEDNQCVPVSEPFARIIDKAISYHRDQRFPDASKMLKAIDDMFKLSQGYKRYVAIQILSSVLACILIVLGALIIIESVNDKIKADFETDYNQYLSALHDGDTGNASITAKKLLNSSDYAALMDAYTTAEVYHGLGDCYKAAEDYDNAVSCYSEAVKRAEYSDSGEDYYRDYALALIESGHTDDAEGVLAEMNRLFPESSSCSLIFAQICSRDNRYDEAYAYIEKALTAAEDDDSKYMSYLILGDINVKNGNYAQAAEAYSIAENISRNPAVLRRLGAAQMKAAASKNDLTTYYSALNTFKTLYEEYYYTEDDVFNLAQCCILTDSVSGAYECIAILENYVSTYPDSCKAYILMTIAADSINDSRASGYAINAHNIYTQLNNSEKSKIDNESMAQIQRLYRKYTKEVW